MSTCPTHISSSLKYLSKKMYLNLITRVISYNIQQKRGYLDFILIIKVFLFSRKKKNHHLIISNQKYIYMNNIVLELIKF